MNKDISDRDLSEVFDLDNWNLEDPYETLVVEPRCPACSKIHKTMREALDCCDPNR